MKSILIKRPYSNKENFFRTFVLNSECIIHDRKFPSNTHINVVNHIPITKENPLYFKEQYYIIDEQKISFFESVSGKFLECSDRNLSLFDIDNIDKENYIFFKKIGNKFRTVKNIINGILTEDIDITFSPNIGTYINAYSTEDILFATWTPRITNDGFYIDDKVLACHEDESEFVMNLEFKSKYDECVVLNRNKKMKRKYDFYKYTNIKLKDLNEVSFVLKNLENNQKIKRPNLNLVKDKIYCIPKDDSLYQNIILCEKDNVSFTKNMRNELTALLTQDGSLAPSTNESISITLNDVEITKKENPNNKCYYRSNITGEIVEFINITTDYNNTEKSIVVFKSKTGKLFFEKFDDFFTYVEDEINGKLYRWVLVDRKKEKYSEINKTFSVF